MIVLSLLIILPHWDFFTDAALLPCCCPPTLLLQCSHVVIILSPLIRYGTKYTKGPIPQAWLASWGDTSQPDHRLHLPPPNLFIPTDFSLRESEAWEGPPRVVLDEPCAFRMHHKCDMTFRCGVISKLQLHQPLVEWKHECNVDHLTTLMLNELTLVE